MDNSEVYWELEEQYKIPNTQAEECYMGKKRVDKRFGKCSLGVWVC